MQRGDVMMCLIMYSVQRCSKNQNLCDKFILSTKHFLVMLNLPCIKLSIEVEEEFRLSKLSINVVCELVSSFCISDGSVQINSVHKTELFVFCFVLSIVLVFSQLYLSES